MKMFVFQYIDQVSENYHSGGGLMVIANDEGHVKELMLNEKYIEITEEDWKKVIVYETNYEGEPKVYVFPDAGCC